MNSGTFYDDLLRLWPALLIPFAIYNMVSLIKNVPKLIKTNVIKREMLTYVGDRLHFPVRCLLPLPAYIHFAAHLNYSRLHLYRARPDSGANFIQLSAFGLRILQASTVLGTRHSHCLAR